MTKTILQKHNATEQGRRNVLDIWGAVENFEHLEPVDRRKRPFQSVNSTVLVGSFRCTNE